MKYTAKKTFIYATTAVAISASGYMIANTSNIEKAVSMPKPSEHQASNLESSKHNISHISQAADPSFSKKEKNAWIEGSLASAYLLNTHLKNFNIEPDMQGNQLILDGTVNTQASKQLAQDIAQSLEANLSVTNNISVDKELALSPAVKKPDAFDQQVEDATLTASIKNEFKRNNLFKKPIDITTRDGVVSLNGDVKTRLLASLAERLAKDTAGVKEVDNNLQVNRKLSYL